MVNLTPNPSFSVTIRLELPNRAGMLASVAQAIASVGGNLGQIDLIEQTLHKIIREISVDASSSEHAEEIVQAVKGLPDLKVLAVYDRTFNLHRAGKISIQSKENSKGLVLKFTDNGCGIPESDLPFIFDKFYRVTREDSKDIEGFGIGLSYVKRVCEWHKWKVEVKNNPDKGITISIQINKNDYE